MLKDDFRKELSLKVNQQIHYTTENKTDTDETTINISN